jgi:hypothetical protein
MAVPIYSQNLMVQSYIVLLPHFVYFPISLMNLSSFPQISLTSTTLAFKKWSTVWTQMETKKIPTTTLQTISPNKALLSLSLFIFLSHFMIFISDFYTKDTLDIFFITQGPSASCQLLPSPSPSTWTTLAQPPTPSMSP